MASIAPLTIERARAILANMASKRVVVLGDVALDEYLVGRAERLSREAPVPVLSFSRRFLVPGGAANPARNVSSLGRRRISSPWSERTKRRQSWKPS